MDDVAPPPRDLSPRAFAAALILLIGVTIAAFAPALRAGLLVWDDQQTIARNPLFQPPSFDSIAWFARHSHMHLYVPATYAAWTVLAAFSQRADGTLAPFAFHAANVLVHLGVVLMSAALLRRVGAGRAGALIGATIVALHPAQVEAVAWASGLKDVASTLLMFAAALAWNATSARRNLWTTLATLAYAIALLTKPTAIVTPLIAGAIAVYAGERPRDAARRLIPWAVLAAAIALIARVVQSPNHGDVAALALRPLLALDAIGWYAHKVVAPVRLCIDHGRTPTRVLRGDVPALPSIAGLLLIATAALATWRLPGRRRHVALGGAIALAALAPVLGIVPFDFQAISGVAEHYLYPAMPGVALVVAALASRASPRASLLIVAAFAGVAAPMTYRQASTWRDDVSLFAQALQVNPSSWSAASAFSYAANARGDIDEAERWARRAINAKPRYPTGWGNLATAQLRRGDTVAAIDSLERARSIAPDDVNVNLNLGGLLAARGELDRALPLLENAADFDPTNPAAQGNLGSALLQSGRAREALRRLDIAVRLAPRDAELRGRRAIAYRELGAIDRARQEVGAGLSIDPASPRLRALRDELQTPP